MTEGGEGLDKKICLGVDVGGTFTDLVAYNEGGGLVAFLKMHTTPNDPSEGVLHAFRQFKTAGLRQPDIRELAHGTTMATNTLLEKKGAKTCLLTTRGFEDILELRRHNRPQMYNLFQEISPPLVPRHLRIGITERLDPRGNVLAPMTEAELLDAIGEIQSHEIESVAICFLHAYANPVHEKKAMEIIRERIPNVFVSCSHQVWPEFREYERTSTTVLNAYIRPSVDRYLRRMGEELSAEGVGVFSVMKSNGGLTSAENARHFPVHLIESGPAAGMISSAWLARGLGVENMITLDVGGTTAKAGTITQGTPRVTTEFHADSLHHGIPVGGYPVRSPVIDLVEIGAGGGSIAWIDKAGILKVGPQSAGAVPGPACYGLGGAEPTVTDANFILGFLNPEYFHGGRTALHREDAERAVYDRIGKYYGWTPEEAAAAIILIAKANLTEMVRLVSIRKGFDPRDFSLLAYGGAGPLHASFIAKDLNIGQTLVPPLAGVFSALGLLVAGVRHDLVRTRPYLTGEMPASAGPKVFKELEGQMMEFLKKEGRDLSKISISRSVDLRYLGQVFELNISILGELASSEEIRSLEIQFEEKYKAAFHYVLPGSRIEVVNFRLTATIDEMKPRTEDLFQGVSETPGAAEFSLRRVFDDQRGEFIEVPSYRMEHLKPGDEINGPAIIDAADTTVCILEDQRSLMDERRCLIIRAA
jgi:N-methylhydantoinase A